MASAAESEPPTIETKVNPLVTSQSQSTLIAPSPDVEPSEVEILKRQIDLLTSELS